MKILSQGKGYVAVHKDSGLVTYADSPDQKNISAQTQAEKLAKKKLFPVHRIDKDTCGVLVFALSIPMAQTLTELFRSRVVKKKYLAIVHGIAAEKGTIDQPLEKNKEKKLEPALTDFTRLAQITLDLEGESRSYSLVRCEPKTGRYHQIRRHLRKIGHPIIGDPEYGNKWDNEVFEKTYGVKRTLLSAISIEFPDREQQKMIRISTKPDPDFNKVMDTFGWNKS